MEERAATEVWFRNPKLYITQMRDVGATNAVWDKGFLKKWKTDAYTYMGRNLGVNTPWQSLVIDDYYARLYNSESSEIKAVWPVWSASEDQFVSLVKHCQNPYGESKYTDDPMVNPLIRPRSGQKHVVVITNLLPLNKTESSAFYEDLQMIQEDYPDVIFFIHGSYSFRLIFGSPYAMGDYDPRVRAKGGYVQLPCGGVEQPPANLYGPSKFWVELMGFTVRDLEQPANRCVFNIKSALWAGKYFKRIDKFGIARGRAGQEDVRLHNFIKQSNLIFTSRVAAKPGDRVVCDECSLWLHCKYFREGAVCAVPNTDMSKIAELFGTRDSRDIVKGLGKLLEVQVQRAEGAVEREAAAEKIDPNLNKLMSEIFSSGEKLLQIVDPVYRKSPGKVDISINGAGNTSVALSTDTDEAQRELASNAIKLLEARGYTREQMTPELLQGAVSSLLQQHSITSTAD